MSTIIRRTIVLSKTNNDTILFQIAQTALSISYSIEYIPKRNKAILILDSIELNCLLFEHPISDKNITESAFLRQYIRHDLTYVDWKDLYERNLIKEKLQNERLEDLKMHSINS